MAHIVFAIVPLAGCMGPALRLAGSLRRHGHRVSFVGVPDCAGFVEPPGFDFHPVLAERYFPGYCQGLRPQAERDRDYREVAREHLREGGGEVETVLRRLEPDLVVCEGSSFDSTFWILVAHRLGVPVAYLTNFLTHSFSSTVPPGLTARLPGETLLSRLGVVLSWLRILGRNRLTLGTSIAQGRLLDLDDDYLRLAREWGFDSRRFRYDTIFRQPKVRGVPEILPCPEELDFPAARHSGCRYLWTAGEAPAEDPGFPWDWLDGERKLVYCSLGTLLWIGRRYTARFYRRVAEVLGARDDLQLVIALGRLERDDLGSLPENVLAVPRAPQVKLLERASFAILHGGFNGVVESAVAGTPVICVPLGWDQPGNAARLVHHGMGLLADPRRIVLGPGSLARRYLERRIARVEEPSFAAAATGMAQRIARLDDREGRVVAELESLLAASSPGAPEARPSTLSTAS